jgi:hypothetical protein
MTAANTTVLALLGKQVSFEYSKHIQLTDQTSVTFSKKSLGIVTAVVISLDSEPEFSIDEGDFFKMSKVTDFKVVE